MGGSHFANSVFDFYDYTHNAEYPNLVREELRGRRSCCDMSIAQSQRAAGNRNRRAPTRRNTKVAHRSVGRAREVGPPPRVIPLRGRSEGVEKEADLLQPRTPIAFRGEEFRDIYK